MNQQETHYRLVIIGSGCAGLTAAIYAARAGLAPVVIAGKMQGGLLTQTGTVENYPGFPDGINGYELMAAMRKQAEHFGAAFLNAEATRLTKERRITLQDGSVLTADAIIVATGSEPRWLGLPAEQRLTGRGVSACATCDGAFYRNLIVAVVGGGDTAMEEALTLTQFAKEVHLIHRRDTFRATKIMLDRVMENPKIAIHTNREVIDMEGDQLLTGLTLKNTLTGETEQLACDGCFVALGHIPGTELVREVLELTPSGCVRLQCNTSMTSVEGIFAAGDCADCTYRQAVMAAGMGCRAAIDAGNWLKNR